MLKYGASSRKYKVDCSSAQTRYSQILTTYSRERSFEYNSSGHHSTTTLLKFTTPPRLVYYAE